MYKRKSKKVSRGEIYNYDFGETEGSVQNGTRPVVVLQANRGPTVIVAPVTSSIKKTNMSSHVHLGMQFGLKKESMLLLEQLQTVNKEDLGDYVGVVGRNTMTLVNNALRKTLKLPEDKERTGDIRCLCIKCLSDYMNNSRYLVRRLDSLAVTQEKCDKCNNYGWDYILVDKKEIRHRRNNNVY